MPFEFDDGGVSAAKIKVVGVGGAGGNAVNYMISANLAGVEFIAVNTDLQALERSRAHQKIQIGRNITRGLGAGAFPDVGRKAIEEDRESVMNALTGCDMVFITAGLGGGTGTGAAPVVAEIAKDLGILTVGIVTKPFRFEGAKRSKNAEIGLTELKDQVDTLIVIPNERLLSVSDKGTSLLSGFKMADDILLQACKGISDVITIPGLVNVDFADVKTVMANMGDALMGTGMASGQNRAITAAQSAISSPLLEGVSIAGAMGVLVNITGGLEMTLHEVNDASQTIHDAAGDEANFIFGTVIDEEMKDEIRITVIATGFNKAAARKVATPVTEQAKPAEIIPSNVKQLEKPAYMRKEQAVKPEEKPLRKAVGYDTSLLSPDELDIPTFLRKQMD